MIRTKPLTRKTPLKPSEKPMRAFRKKRRPGNKPMDREERLRTQDAKELKCIPCLVWARMGNMPLSDVAVCSDFNHAKSGNLRVNHKHGFAACLWHHKAQIDRDGFTHAFMRQHFGPSLAEGSRTFHDTYGSDKELIALQKQLLGEETC